MKKGFSVVYIIIVVLAIFIVAGGAYYAGTQKKSNIVPTPTPGPENLVGNDRDEHGCIPSAGYSWCELKQKCLRTWEEPCAEVTLTPMVTTAPAVDETTALKAFIKQALIAKHGSDADELNITVSKIEGNYAQGGASGEGGGGMWFAAKVNGQWKLVWDGNGVILCSDLEAYPQFPTGMIPECYNDKTGKSVKR